MRQRQVHPNPLANPNTKWVTTVKLGKQLVVVWRSIGLTTDGFTFYYDLDAVEHALKDQSSRIKYNHCFDSEAGKRHQYTTQGSQLKYYSCCCGCGLIAADMGREFEYYADIDSLLEAHQQPAFGLN
jgi:hypothetical protein